MADAKTGGVFQKVIPLAHNGDGDLVEAFGPDATPQTVTLSDDITLVIDTLPLPTGAAKEAGTDNMTTGVASIPTTTGGTTIVAARAGRRGVEVRNLGTQIVYVNGGTPTSANWPLYPNGEAVWLPTAGIVKGLSASGTQSVAYAEFY